MVINANEINLIEVNACTKEHLENIKKSISQKGFVGTPVFYDKNRNRLLTGSHRYKACQELNTDIEIIDIGDIVERYLNANELEFDEINFEDINDLDEYEIKRYFSQFNDEQ